MSPDSKCYDFFQSWNSFISNLAFSFIQRNVEVRGEKGEKGEKLLQSRIWEDGKRIRWVDNENEGEGDNNNNGGDER